MYSFLITVHVVVSIFLVLIVLIQAGRSGGLSGLMGGGGGDALFSTSSQQAGLRKATVVIAIIFMFTSLGLTVLSSRRAGETVFQRRLPALPQTQAPAPQTKQSAAPSSGGEAAQSIPVGPTGDSRKAQ